MRSFLTYVLAALAASLAVRIAEAVKTYALWSDSFAAGDPRLIAGEVAGGLIDVAAAAVVFLLIMGTIWLVAQLVLRRTIGEARGFWALGLAVALFVGVTVGASIVMWTVLDFGVDVATFGGLDRVLLSEAIGGAAAGLGWGLVFWLRTASASAPKPAEAGA